MPQTPGGTAISVRHAYAVAASGLISTAYSLVFQNIFVPETFRGRREETDADRAGLKRHLRVRVLPPQPWSRGVSRGRLLLQATSRFAVRRAPRQ
jgi:hypothetical protein